MRISIDSGKSFCGASVPQPHSAVASYSRREALKQNLQGKLNLAGIGAGRDDPAKRRVWSTAAVHCLHERAGIGQGVIGVVEQIEELRAELQADLFLDGRLLHHCVVHVDDAGTGQEVSLQIAERAWRRQRKRGWVGVLGGGAVYDLIRR